MKTTKAQFDPIDFVETFERTGNKVEIFHDRDGDGSYAIFINGVLRAHRYRRLNAQKAAIRIIDGWYQS